MESHKLPDVKKKIVMKSWVIGQKESTNHKSRITNHESRISKVKWYRFHLQFSPSRFLSTLKLKDVES